MFLRPRVWYELRGTVSIERDTRRDHWHRHMTINLRRLGMAVCCCLCAYISNRPAPKGSHNSVIPIMSSEKPAVANSKGAPRPHYRQQRKKAPSKKDTVEKPSACIEPPALAVIQNDAPIKTVPGREPIHDEIIKKKRINHKRNAAKITTPSTTAPTPTPEAAARHPPQKQPEQKPQPVRPQNISFVAEDCGLTHLNYSAGESWACAVFSCQHLLNYLKPHRIRLVNLCQIPL